MSVIVARSGSSVFKSITNLRRHMPPFWHAPRMLNSHPQGIIFLAYANHYDCPQEPSEHDLFEEDKVLGSHLHRKCLWGIPKPFLWWTIPFRKISDLSSAALPASYWHSIDVIKKRKIFVAGLVCQVRKLSRVVKVTTWYGVPILPYVSW